MASNIGIKIANGEFYSIMEENSSVKKRLILTTVHDDQPSVQIDLYRSVLKSMSDSQYIGSLVVENVKLRPKGEPSIEMVISSNENGDIIADAIDLDTSAGGEHYVLSVSLKTLDETSRDVVLPDFELESNEEPPTGLYQHANKIRQEKKRSTLIGILVIVGIIIILGLAAVWFYFFGGRETVFSYLDSIKTVAVQPAKESAPKPEPVKPEPEPVKPEPVPEPVKPEPEPVKPEPVVESPPVIVAPVEPPAPKPQPVVSKRPPPPVASYKVPATIPKEGVAYRIRWGDTLWDIAEAFYRNPWLYPRIARHNNIRNPDLIISGRTIRIPPKN
ncbi:MAG: LysM peptidoglycan-binding domain-containing protein [Treponema sp.]|jgi:hypothetical protein|nr:LysM peptidoglycan-binding domain-containing protein [Treponema sp.]